jgi:hypothetical protein
MTAKTRDGVHVFIADPALRADHNGGGYCVGCGLPERNTVHTMPAVDPDVLAAERRRTGEH